MANQKTLTIELTKEGFDELQTELTELKNFKLPAVIARVAKAREHGDLSENAEYHSAQDDQQLIETRIAEIDSILSKAKVVQHTKSSIKVGIGSKVEVKKKGAKKSTTFNIVGEYESNPAEGKISSVSPLGKALIGKKKGDTVQVEAPSGKISYEILQIK